MLDVSSSFSAGEILCSFWVCEKEVVGVLSVYEGLKHNWLVGQSFKNEQTIFHLKRVHTESVA